jgi:hypothetical protein
MELAPDVQCGRGHQHSNPGPQYRPDPASPEWSDEDGLSNAPPAAPIIVILTSRIDQIEQIGLYDAAGSAMRNQRDLGIGVLVIFVKGLSPKVPAEPSNSKVYRRKQTLLPAWTPVRIDAPVPQQATVLASGCDTLLYQF